MPLFIPSKTPFLVVISALWILTTPSISKAQSIIKGDTDHAAALKPTVKQLVSFVEKCTLKYSMEEKYFHAANLAELEKLFLLAESDQLYQLLHLEQIIESIAELLVNKEALPILEEVVDIAEVKGVGAGIAHLEAQQTKIIDLAKAKTKVSARRSCLQLLRFTASIQVVTRRYDSSRANYREIIKVDPLWVVALDSYATLLSHITLQSKYDRPLNEALLDAEELLSTSQILYNVARHDPRAHRMFAIALHRSSDVLLKRGSEGDADKIISRLQRSLNIFENLHQQNRGSAEAGQDLAEALRRVGLFFSVRGLPGDAKIALEYYTRSLRINEVNLKHHPGHPDVEKSLSVSLNKMGDTLRDRGLSGDIEKAQEYYTRCLDISEKLFKADLKSDKKARTVAIASQDLAKLLLDVGRPKDVEKAMKLFESSLKLVERLYSDHPESPTSAYDLTSVLDGFGGALYNHGPSGCTEVIVAYHTRSVDINEKMLLSSPDSGEAARNLARSLIKLGDVLARRDQDGDILAAQKHFQRSLELHEKNMSANPDWAQAAHDVSVSLERLGDMLSRDTGNRDDGKAIEYYMKSREIHDKLFTSANHSARASRDLAISLIKIGDVLMHRRSPGDISKAQESYEHSLEILETMLKSNPDVADVVLNVSACLSRLIGLVEILRPIGLVRTLKICSRCEDIAISLLKANPGSSRCTINLSLINLKKADLLEKSRNEGDSKEAEKKYAFSLKLLEKLWQTDPRSAEATEALTVALHQFGDFLVSHGDSKDSEKAHEYYERALKMNQHALESNLFANTAAENVQQSLRRLGDFYSTRGLDGDIPKAAAYYSKRIGVLLKRINISNANANLEVIREAALAMMNFGDFASQYAPPGDTIEADLRRDSLGLFEILWKAQPNAEQAMRDLSIAQNKTGDLMIRRNQKDDAEQSLQYFTRSMELSEKLLEAQPESTAAARHAWMTSVRLADHAKRNGTGDAEKWLRRTFEILHYMETRNHPLSDDERNLLKSLKKNE